MLYNLQIIKITRIESSLSNIHIQKFYSSKFIRFIYRYWYLNRRYPKPNQLGNLCWKWRHSYCLSISPAIDSYHLRPRLLEWEPKNSSGNSLTHIVNFTHCYPQNWESVTSQTRARLKLIIVLVISKGFIKH